MLALFPAYRWYRTEREVEVLIARIALDQSVRLENSIDILENNSSHPSRLVVWLNVLLALMTAALVALAVVTYAKG